MKASELPLLDWLRRGASRGRGTLALLGLLAAVDLALCALLVSPAVQRSFMAKFHLRSGSYALWALQQLVPNMYSFDNEAVLGPPFDLRRKVNHYPTQLVTNPWNRPAFLPYAGPIALAARSRYRGQQTTTLYAVEVRPRERTLALRRIVGDGP